MLTTPATASAPRRCWAGAVLKDFDALDGSPRDGIEINESRRASFTRALGIGSEAPSMSRNQRAADGETAQGDGGGATRVSATVVDRWHASKTCDGKRRSSSAVVRSPDSSICSRLISCTGFGPTSSAVGMCEPVTITRSVSAADSGEGEGVGLCANAPEATRARMHPALIRTDAVQESGNIRFLWGHAPFIAHSCAQINSAARDVNAIVSTTPSLLGHFSPGHKIENCSAQFLAVCWIVRVEFKVQRSRDG